MPRLSSNQRDFDCLSEQLLEEAQIDRGRLLLGDEQFSVLVLPEMRMLARASLQKICAFLQSGGTVAFVGSLPCQTPSRGDDAEMTQAAKKLLADYPRNTSHLADASDCSEMIAWINKRVPAKVVWKGPNNVRILRRQEPDRVILLVANPSNKDTEGGLTVPLTGEASVWNPETGEILRIDTLSLGHEISLQVPAQSARFVVVE